MRTKNDKDKIEIGLRIKELRTNLGLSQEDLAKLVGYKSANSRSTINKIEMGINDIAQSKLTVYAAALQTTVTYLLFGTNNEDVPSSATKGQMQLWDEQYNEKNQLQTEVQIIEAVQKHFGKDAVTLLHLFNTLNKSGQKKAVENLEDLSAIERYTTNETIHIIKKAARNGSFEEKAITNDELDEIKNLPNVDDLK